MFLSVPLIPFVHSSAQNQEWRFGLELKNAKLGLVKRLQAEISSGKFVSCATPVLKNSVCLHCMLLCGINILAVVYCEIFIDVYCWSVWNCESKPGCLHRLVASCRIVKGECGWDTVCVCWHGSWLLYHLTLTRHTWLWLVKVQEFWH